MKLKTLFVFTLVCVASCERISSATCVGNGEPDLYFFGSSGFGIQTSAGFVSRPEGTLLLDTDGTDIVAVLVGGPNVIDRLDRSYHLTDGGFLPDPDAPPFFLSTWSVGYANGAMQWIRTSPLTTDGFRGVIGEYDDPGILFPSWGLADYESTGLNPPHSSNFEDESGFSWEAILATESGEVFYTDVRSSMGGYLRPEPKDDQFTVLQGGILDSAAEGLPSLSSNDFDHDCSILEATLATPPSHGDVSVQLDGSFVYTHDGSGALTDTFSYYVTDGYYYDRMAEGFVTISIVPEPAGALLCCLTTLMVVLRRR